jgi:hypothetical protein
MQADVAWLDEAESLIALYGADAITTLVNRISDAVRDSDDQAVNRLDQILQLVEARVEQPWRLRAATGSARLPAS